MIVVMTKKQEKEAAIAAMLIESVWSSIQCHKWPDPPFFPIGNVEKRMMDFAKSNAVSLASDVIYMDYKQIAHATRRFKKEK